MQWPVTRIEAFRKAKGWRLQELGQALGRTQSQAQRYCAGLTRPDRTASDALSALTFGVIHVGNYAQQITEAEAARMMAAIEVAERAQLEPRHD